MSCIVIVRRVPNGRRHIGDVSDILNGMNSYVGSIHIQSGDYRVIIIPDGNYDELIAMGLYKSHVHPATGNILLGHICYVDIFALEAKVRKDNGVFELKNDDSIRVTMQVFKQYVVHKNLPTFNGILGND